MLIDGCNTGSKLGHFPKTANLINQNGRGQILDKENWKYLVAQFRWKSANLVVQKVPISFDLVKKRVVTLLRVQ